MRELIQCFGEVKCESNGKTYIWDRIYIEKYGVICDFLYNIKSFGYNVTKVILFDLQRYKLPIWFALSGIILDIISEDNLWLYIFMLNWSYHIII